MRRQECANKPNAIPELRDEFVRVINGIQQGLQRIVMANVIKRAEVCRAKLGDHVADIIYLLSTFEKLFLVM